MQIKKMLKSLINVVKEEKKIPIPSQINTTELLVGRVALITGGSGGIGYAVAKSFLQNGAKVVLAGTSELKLQKCLEQLQEEMPDADSAKMRTIVINVLDTSSLKDKVNQAASLFEENRIDILVNSAGVINHSDFWNMTEKEYDKIMDINVKGTFFMCQTVGTLMVEKKIKGHILNISSSSALRPAWTPYQMSKWSIRGFTIGLADTLLPYGITVNAIAPGPVATEMLGRANCDSIDNKNAVYGRYAEPEEIANLAAFMVSKMGDMIVGDTVYISGGSGIISMHK